MNLFLSKARSLAESSPAPWTPQKRGQPPYPPKAMVTLLLLKTWLGMDYRSINAYLRAFPEQRIKVGLEETPSHTTIRNHMALVVKADVSKPDQVQAMREQVLDEFRGVDILVNNAGIHQHLKSWETSHVDWRHVLDVNLDGPFLCCKAFTPEMRDKK